MEREAAVVDRRFRHAIRPVELQLPLGYTPDIALVHIGTNDIWQGQSVESTIDEIRQIMAVLRRANPAVSIMLARLIPGKPYDVRALNAAIDVLAKAESTARSAVAVVDQFQGFDVARDTHDGVHPNRRGDEKMGQRWYEALTALLANKHSSDATREPTR